jgi:two-component system response regulator PhoP
MRILLIEDETALREELTQQLRQQGHVVDSSGDGQEGWYLGQEYPVDVAVVDLGLPSMDGISILNHWRQNEQRFPVLILTARGRWQDKVAGLEAGADDYLVKPFQFEELLARLRALVRRASGWTHAILRCDPVALDTHSQTVTVADQPVELTAYEYRVLEHLMLHAGEVVSKTELSEHLYQEELDRDSNVLEVLIGRLRRKLDPERTLQPIETLRGRGYRFQLARSP